MFWSQYEFTYLGTALNRVAEHREFEELLATPIAANDE